MKGFCKSCGTIVLVLGMIGSVVCAVVFGKVVDFTTTYRVYYERSIPLTLAWLIGGVLSTTLLAVIFYALGEILERLETLEYHSQTMDASEDTPIGLLSEEARKQKILAEDGWKCPKCGRVNQNYIGTCVCGESKS